MPFWSENFGDGTGLKDPKRKFRFLVTMTGLTNTADSGVPSQLFYAKSATKPSFAVAAAEHKYLNHTFYYPGSVSWNDVVITMVDPSGPDVAATLSDIVVQSGYVVPGTQSDLATMSKAGAASALGTVEIEQLGGDGVAVESWTLHNAFVTEIKYGDLAYGEDDLTELSLTLKYDWATLVTTGDGAKTSGTKTFFDKKAAATAS